MPLNSQKCFLEADLHFQQKNSSIFLYICIEDTKCTTNSSNALDRISDSTKYELPNQRSVLGRFANCFGKAFAMKTSDRIKVKAN